jgi:hypothetical protein
MHLLAVALATRLPGVSTRLALAGACMGLGFKHLPMEIPAGNSAVLELSIR